MSVDISEELVRAAADYVPDTTGHVVIAEGAGEDRAPAVAVWHVSPTGQPTGAWIRPVSMLNSDPEAARQLLFLTSHRALLAWDPATAVRSLDAIASWAHITRAPSLPAVRLPEVLKPTRTWTCSTSMSTTWNRRSNVRQSRGGRSAQGWADSGSTRVTRWCSPASSTSLARSRKRERSMPA